MQFIFKKYSWLKFSLMIILAATLCSCGFHLRGLDMNIPDSLKKLYIQNDTNDYQLENALKSVLASYKVDLVKNPKDATATLIISKVDTSNNMQSVTGNLSAGEYLVTYSVSYKIIDSKGHTLLSERESTHSSTYSSNATQQLSANYQVEQIKNKLSTKAANDIVSSFSQIKVTDSDDDNIIIPDEKINS